MLKPEEEVEPTKEILRMKVKCTKCNTIFKYANKDNKAPAKNYVCPKCSGKKPTKARNLKDA